jgi:hypothetical protein
MSAVLFCRPDRSLLHLPTPRNGTKEPTTAYARCASGYRAGFCPVSVETSIPLNKDANDAKDANGYPRLSKAELYSQLADPCVDCHAADNAKRWGTEFRIGIRELRMVQRIEKLRPK